MFRQIQASRLITLFILIAAVGGLLLAGFRALVPDTNEGLEKPRFLIIQELYETARQERDCLRIDSLLAVLAGYSSDQERLSPDQIQSVIFPRKKISPTVGDFALDRQIRLKDYRKTLCP